MLSTALPMNFSLKSEATLLVGVEVHLAIQPLKPNAIYRSLCSITVDVVWQALLDQVLTTHCKTR